DAGDRVMADIDAALAHAVVAECDRLELAIAPDHLVAHEAGVIRLVGLDQRHLDRRIAHPDVARHRAAADAAADDDHLLLALRDREAGCSQRQACRAGGENEAPARNVVRHDPFPLTSGWHRNAPAPRSPFRSGPSCWRASSWASRDGRR